MSSVPWEKVLFSGHVLGGVVGGITGGALGGGVGAALSTRKGKILPSFADRAALVLGATTSLCTAHAVIGPKGYAPAFLGGVFGGGLGSIVAKVTKRRHLGVVVGSVAGGVLGLGFGVSAAYHSLTDGGKKQPKDEHVGWWARYVDDYLSTMEPPDDCVIYKCEDTEYFVPSDKFPIQ